MRTAVLHLVVVGAAVVHAMVSAQTRRAAVFSAAAAAVPPLASTASPMVAVAPLACGANCHSRTVEAQIAKDMARRAEEVRRDVAYPPAVVGDWLCMRQIQKVDGSTPDAEAAWRALGGRGKFGKAELERFQTRFVPIPDTRRKAGVMARPVSP